MSDKPASPYAYLAAVPLGIATSVWCAYVMTYWWAWFVVPLGVPAIGTLHAWALCCVTWFVGRGFAFASLERADVMPKYATTSYVVAKPILVAALTGVAFGMLYLLHRMM